MPHVYAGKILKIDLTTRQTSVRLVRAAEVEAFLLGSGLAAKIYYEEFRPLLDPQLDVFDPRNPLIVMNGLLSGTFAPTGDGGSATGTWRSQPLTAPIGGWLKFETAGDLGVPGAGVSLRLLDPQTGRILGEVAPGKRPGDTWRAAYVKAPHGPFVIAASDESPRTWLAFSPPVEMGVWSYRAWQLTKHGLLIVYVTAGVTLLLLVIAWRESRSGASRL